MALMRLQSPSLGRRKIMSLDASGVQTKICQGWHVEGQKVPPAVADPIAMPLEHLLHLLPVFSGKVFVLNEDQLGRIFSKIHCF
jgi:hypothetical protein